MSTVAKFTETIYRDQNKKGVLPAPDSNGYYTLMIGALNCYNTSREYYVANNAIKLFHESSPFMRRIQAGCLYAELGHPRRTPGMSYADFYSRMIDIDEKNVCAHFAEVWLDTSYGRKNPDANNSDMVAIFAKVKPHGPHAATLQASLDTPQQNTSFSIRGITDNHERNGRIERELTTVITFDHVVMPGIPRACKAFAPGLESSNLVLESGQDVVVQYDLLKNVVSHIRRPGSVATESSRMVADELRQLFDKQKAAALPKW